MSLLSGPFLTALTWATVAALGALVLRRSAAWLRRLVAVTGVWLAGLAGAAAVVAWAHLFGFSFPPSFYLWVGLPVLAVALAVFGWRGSPNWRRIVSVVAVPLTALTGAAVINAHYGYYPTLASLFGRDAAHHVDLRAVVATERQVALHQGTPPSHGDVVTVDIPATTSGFVHRPALVYLPPAWFESPRPRLPVLMMLAGTPGFTADWTRAGLADVITDQWAAAHGGLAPILVLPDANGSATGDTECVDGPRGRAETYLTQDVVAFVAATYGASSAAQDWGIVGLSEGGTCALDLTLRHPDRFSTFVDLSGDLGPNLGSRHNTVLRLFGGSQAAWLDHDPLTIMRTTRFTNVAGWFDSGSGDRGALQPQRRLVPAAQAAGIQTCVSVQPGGHDFRFWSAGFREALPWLAARLGLLAGDPARAAACPQPTRVSSTVTPSWSAGPP